MLHVEIFSFARSTPMLSICCLPIYTFFSHSLAPSFSLFLSLCRGVVVVVVFFILYFNFSLLYFHSLSISLDIVVVVCVCADSIQPIACLPYFNSVLYTGIAETHTEEAKKIDQNEKD